MATTEADPMLENHISIADVLESEVALLKCWPTLETVEDGQWIIRLADGYTGRANSVQCLDPADNSNVEVRLNRALKLFEARNIVPIVRATPLTFEALFTEVDRRGWREFGHTNVMRVELDDRAAGSTLLEIETHEIPSQVWQNATTNVLGLSVENAKTRISIIERMPASSQGLLVRDGGTPIAGLLANISDRTGCIFSLEVSPSARRQGLGAALMQAAKVWMAEQGAKYCTLQVEQNNVGANKLYARLGFETVYTYHYYSAEGSR